MHGDERKKYMKKSTKILLTILLLPLALFLITFGIYFFNLDMKLTSYVVEPILLKHYDKIKRKQYV